MRRVNRSDGSDGTASRRRRRTYLEEQRKTARNKWRCDVISGELHLLWRRRSLIPTESNHSPVLGAVISLTRLLPFKTDFLDRRYVNMCRHLIFLKWEKQMKNAHSDMSRAHQQRRFWNSSKQTWTINSTQMPLQRWPWPRYSVQHQCHCSVLASFAPFSCSPNQQIEIYESY